MRLADLVYRETGVAADHVMFLRHSNESVAFLRSVGASIEEYTATQPVGSKYDFFHADRPRTEVVVVIVEDRIYGIYRVTGIGAEGMSDAICSPEYSRFDQARRKAARMCRRFVLESLHTAAEGLVVRGWERRTRTPVQRGGDSFFSEIAVEVSAPLEPQTIEQFEQRFAQSLERAAESNREERLRRLARAPKIPPKVKLLATAFVRNPDVVAEALYLAAGVCGSCCNPAPFVRAAGGKPYLEVHHKIRLADGGMDSVENAIALCPNCHRKSHYG
jgi:5-methylcytosine-specific restriction endonuclease McrA